MIKAFARSCLPTKQQAFLRQRLNVIRAGKEYSKDKARFLQASSAAQLPLEQGRLTAHLTMDYHRLEKGMALPNTRIGFGKDVIKRLLSNLAQYTERFGQDELTRIVHGVLRQYQTRQAALGFANPALDAALDQMRQTHADPAVSCGVTPLPLADLFAVDEAAGQQFLESRHSVRQYTGELVSDAQIARIAEIAQRAPSVCNRQCGRLYVANTRERIAEVLSYQNGNGGFGDRLGAVFIVTADLRSFVSLGERHQGYVDGGIFAMQTLLAIHSLHLGGCMLNWSMTHHDDERLRAAFGIPAHEVVITMIGFGHCVAAPEIAVSPRIALSEVLKPL